MRTLLLFSLWFFWGIGFSQNITTATVDIYQDGSLVDTQVFTGFTPATSISEELTVNTSALNPGMHTFTVTLMDADGVSSILETGVFFHETKVSIDAQITAMEYFFDSDPGSGGATSIATSPSAEVIATETLNTSGLAEGFHTLHLRGIDENNNWGPYATSTIYVNSGIGFNDVVQISALEYFIDTDPGAGNGTPITVSTANNLSLTETIDLSGITSGFHTVYLRGKLENGAWGPYTTQTIYVESSTGFADAVNIEALEYFVDTDPGIGSGTAISVSPNSELSLTQSLDLTSLTPGFHTLYLRGKLENGTWGAYTTQTILVESSVGLADAVVIESLEYFIDTDPGFGEGMAISITPATLQQLNENINVSGESLGFHTLYLRGKLENGTWGPYRSATILVEGSTSGNQITAIEYFIDTDPGVGTATVASGTFPVGNFTETVNLATASLTPGTHQISVRAQDDQGRWGNYLTQQIEVLSPELNQSLADGDWNNVATWSRNAVPAENDSVVVAHAINFDVSSASVFALTLTTGGNLDLNTHEVHVKGRFKKESGGILTPSSGKVVLDGGTQTYQHEGDITFFQLEFGGTGTKILDFTSGDELIISDSLGIASGVLLDIQQNNEIRLTGNAEFVNNGGISSTEKWSLIAAGTNHSISGGDFNNLTLESTVTVSLSSDFQYSGSFTSPGTGATIDLNESTMNIGTSWTFSDSDNLTFGSNGTLSAPTGTSFSNAVELPNLVINSSTETFNASTNLTFSTGKSLTINSGTVVSEALTFSGSGGITLTEGTLSLTNQVVTFGNGGSINNNGGQIDISGSSSAVQRATTSDQFTITQNSGNLNWSDVTLSGTGGNGLTLLGGSATLTNLTFENGSDASYLTFGSGFDGQTFSGFTFANGPTNNVAINDGVAETITFDEYQGEFGGADHDKPGTSGTINWTNEIVPDVTPPVITVTIASTLDQSPSIGGTIDDNAATVIVTIDGVEYTDVLVTGGNWSIEEDVIGPLDVGNYEVTASATDTSGNEGTDMSNDELTILPATNTADAASGIGINQFTSNWSAASGGVNQYLLDVSSSSEFSTFIDGYENSAISGTSSPVTGLSSNTAYYYRVRVQYNSGDISDYSNTIEVTTLEEDTTAPVITISATSTTDLSPELSGTIDDNDATIEITINSVAYSDISITDGTWSIADNVIGPLDVGTYEVIAKATDTNANEGIDTSNDELTILPSATTANAAIEIGSSQFTANWSTGSGGVNQYLLDVSTDAEFSTFIDGFENAVVTETSNSVSGLSKNSTYYYRVRVQYNSGDISAYSNNIGVTTLDEDTTAPVITVNTSSTSDLSPSISGTIDDNNATVTVTINDIEYTDITINDGQWSLADDIVGPLDVGIYNIVANATDTSGNEGSDSTSDELTVLPSPTDAQDATAIGTEGFTANWTAVDGGISNYLLDISTQTDFSSFIIGYESAPITGTNQEVTDLSNNTTYFYRVRAAFSSGDISDYSDTIQVITTGEPPVITISNLSTLERSPALSGTVDVDVETVVLSINDITYTDVSASEGNWSVTSGTIGPLDVGTYDILATATDMDGNVGTDESTDELVILPSPTDALDATEVNSNSFIANWTQVEGGVSHYLLDVSTQMDFSNFLPDLENAVQENLSLAISNLNSSTNYFYRIRVVYNSGDISDYSDTIAVTTLQVTFSAIDSLALVQIYEDLNGPDWTNNDSWLSGNLDSWHGVAVDGTRVTDLELANNNLSGDLTAIATGLDLLDTLDLSQNSIISISTISSLTNTTYINVSENHLQFGSLETLVEITNEIAYDNQAVTLTQEVISEEAGNNVIVDRTVSGTNNIYRWFKNGEELSNDGPTLSLENLSLADEGNYLVNVTNSSVPDLTLITNAVTISIPSLTKDRSALLTIYEALDGPNWTNDADWPNQDQNDLDSWVGIEVIDGRVGTVSLSGNNLTGEVPGAVTELTRTTEIDMSGNDISGLPDMSSMTNLSTLNLSGNLLDFEDLEPNANIIGIDYNNQQPFGVIDQTINIDKGGDYLLEFQVNGSANEYKWQANGPVINGVIDGANESSFQIEEIDYSNMGTYTLSATNELVPNLTLSSHPVLVNATADISLNPTYFDIDDEATVLDEGTIHLLQILAPQAPYDSVQQLNIEEEGLTFNDVVLGDYLIAIRTDTLFLREKGGRTDSVRLLPTYFESTFLWEAADTLLLRENIARNLGMQARPDELTPADGDGTVALSVESDFASDAEKDGLERIEARRKVKRAGCSLRRRRRASGGRVLDDDEFELVVYKETDDNGQVTFNYLPEGTYRLNIEYPGIPMDPSSFVEFNVGEGGIEDNSLTLEATVSEEGIIVELVEELGFYRQYFKDLELYPNPADRELNIKYSKLISGDVYVQLINLQGKTIIEQAVPEGFNQLLQLNISDQDPGMYLLRFVDPSSKSPTLISYRVLISR